ncbi:hypothetical protein BJX76DRAFT_346018 [Aspergillus varians]
MSQTTQIPYNELDPFRGEYSRVTATAPEDRVGAMWSVILASIFPVTKYAIEPQFQNPVGYTDFTISEWANTGGQLIRLPCFVVETRRAAASSQEAWKEAEVQLQEYLIGHTQIAATGGTGKARLFGAVAIGTEVKFFTYNKSTKRINPLYHQKQPYEQRLQYIERHHYI